MKNKNEEQRLFKALGGSEDRYIAEAFRADDKETFDALKKDGESRNKKRAGILSRAKKRILIIAACFALVAALLAAIPGIMAAVKRDPERLQRTSETVEKETPVDVSLLPAPELYIDEKGLALDSMDKVNYYSAIAAISVSREEALKNGQSAGASYGKQKILYDQEPVSVEVTKEEATAETADGGRENNGDNGPRDYIAYDLSKEVFTVRRSYFFMIRLTDPDGFLASRIGCGEVCVAINDLGEEKLITFKNGDRYYSCTSPGGGEYRSDCDYSLIFSTHRYFEGFYLVKDLRSDTYRFDVAVQGKSLIDGSGQVVSLTCTPWKVGGEFADRDIEIITSTVESVKNYSFTLERLGELLAGMMEKNTAVRIAVFDDPSVADSIPEQTKRDLAVNCFGPGEEELPGSRTVIIRSREEYDRYFTDRAQTGVLPESIDFEKETAILYTFCATDNRRCTAAEAITTDGTLYIALTRWVDPTAGGIVTAYQRYILIVTGKTDAGNVGILT